MRTRHPHDPSLEMCVAMGGHWASALAFRSPIDMVCAAHSYSAPPSVFLGGPTTRPGLTSATYGFPGASDPFRPESLALRQELVPIGGQAAPAGPPGMVWTDPPGGLPSLNRLPMGSYPLSMPMGSLYTVPPHSSFQAASSRLLPKRAVDRLHEWLSAHIHHPYASREETLSLARETQLAESQVTNWFNKARRRLRRVQRLPATATQVLKHWFDSHGQRMPGRADLAQLSRELNITAAQVTLWFTLAIAGPGPAQGSIPGAGTGATMVAAAAAAAAAEAALPAELVLDPQQPPPPPPQHRPALLAVGSAGPRGSEQESTARAPTGESARTRTAARSAVGTVTGQPDPDGDSGEDDTPGHARHADEEFAGDVAQATSSDDNESESDASDGDDDESAAGLGRDETGSRSASGHSSSSQPAGRSRRQNKTQPAVKRRAVRAHGTAAVVSPLFSSSSAAAARATHRTGLMPAHPGMESAGGAVGGGGSVPGGGAPPSNARDSTGSESEFNPDDNDSEPSRPMTRRRRAPARSGLLGAVQGVAGRRNSTSNFMAGSGSNTGAAERSVSAAGPSHVSPSAMLDSLVAVALSGRPSDFASDRAAVPPPPLSPFQPPPAPPQLSLPPPVLPLARPGPAATSALARSGSDAGYAPASSSVVRSRIPTPPSLLSVTPLAGLKRTVAQR